MLTEALVVLEECPGPYLVLTEPVGAIPAGWLMHLCDDCILFPCPTWKRAWSDARGTPDPRAGAGAGAAPTSPPRDPHPSRSLSAREDDRDRPLSAREDDRHLTDS